MKKLKIKLPEDLKNLPLPERVKIVDSIQKALDIPQPTNPDPHKSNMWERNSESLLAEAEDQLYYELWNPWQEAVLELIAELGLTAPELQKSFEPEYWEFAGELQKSKISDLIELNKKKRAKFLKYIQDGQAWTKKQLAKIDDILRSKLPNYAKVAERYAVRAGYLGKIRGKADTEVLEMAGALIDRFPETITRARKEGVTVNMRNANKKIAILPLTPLEANSVEMARQMAGDKLTEKSEEHISEVRRLVVRAKKERWSPDKLASELFNALPNQNRDWRRVAITELAMATNDAFIAGCEEGDTLYVPPVAGACDQCKRLIEGKTFTVTYKPRDTWEHENNYIWAGKTNYGRKTTSWQPCVPLHPNCRHRLHKISKFYKVVDGKMVQKTASEMIQEERARRGLPPDPNLR